MYTVFNRIQIEPESVALSLSLYTNDVLSTLCSIIPSKAQNVIGFRAVLCFLPSSKHVFIGNDKNAPTDGKSNTRTRNLLRKGRMYCYPRGKE